MGGLIMASTINADTTNGVVVTSDTSGEIELQSAGVTKAKVTANGLQDANGNSLRGGMYRNLIINGDMQIAQRGTSVSGVTSTGYHTVDRILHSIANIGTWTISQDTDVPTGQGFANSLKMDCTTANGSLLVSSVGILIYRLEGQMLQHLKKGTSNAESVTLSFWVKSNKTGTYVCELGDSDNTRHIAQTYTIDSADTWEKKTLTFAGDTTGAFANDNGTSLQLNLWIAAGTNFSSGTTPTSWASTVNANRAAGLTVNLADNTANYINITGVQLEVGEGASDFEFLPYDVQLQRCQRYFLRWTANANLVICNMAAYSTTGIYGVFVYPTTMRATPSWSVSSASHLTLYMGGTTQAPSAFSASTITENSARLNVTASSARTQGDAGWLRVNTGGGKYIQADAEL